MSFNKTDSVTLAGNRVEERTPRDDTGATRTPSVGARLLDTGAKILSHSSHKNLKQHRSSARVETDIKRHAHTHVDSNALGPRARRLQKQIEQEALEATAIRESAKMMYLQTTNRADFTRHRDSEYTSEKGRRIMKTMDGVPLPLDARDSEFLSSTGVSKRPTKLGFHESSELAAREVAPITIYSQRLAEGCFPATAADAVNPFARSSKFTNDIRDPQTLTAEAYDKTTKQLTTVASSLRPAAGGLLARDTVLNRVVGLLRSVVGCAGVLVFGRILSELDSGGNGASQADLIFALKQLGINITGRDAAALVALFDSDKSGSVSRVELIRGMEAQLSDDQQKLVREAFQRVQAVQSQPSLSSMMAVFHASAFPEVIAGKCSAAAVEDLLHSFFNHAGRQTLDTFVHLHAAIAACCASAQEFDATVRGCWGLAAPKVERPRTRVVRVQFLDGVSEDMEIDDPIGFTRSDESAIKTRLRKLGVKRVHSVKLLD